MKPRGRAVAVATALTLFAACSLGDKADQAERIIESVDLTIAAGSVRGTITLTDAIVSLPEIANVEVSTDTTPGAAEGDAGGLAAGPFQPRPPIVFDIAVDLGEQRSALSYPGSPTPFAVLDGDDLYARRYNAGHARRTPMGVRTRRRSQGR